jgi:hypothetical protein
MAGVSEQSIDPKRTIVVLNFPSNVGEDELTIYFQKERNGGGDVDDVALDGSVAFVTFDMPEGLEYFIYIPLNNVVSRFVSGGILLCKQISKDKLRAELSYS